MIRIGTRGSKLALWQAQWVKSRIESARPGVDVRLEVIRTSGDKILDVPLAQVGGKGLFVKEIEEALAGRRVDLAVHSMKDLPTQLAPGMILAAITRREDPRDVLISRNGTGLRRLAPGARIGTSSLRRQAQILHLRPDLHLMPLRGNLDTRLRKLDETDLSAIVVAAAGIARMGWTDRVTEFLPLQICLPAIGQGALGIECRDEDRATREIVSFLDDPTTRRAVAAERAFLERLEGGCQVPIGGHATIEEGTLRLEGLIASVDGKRLVRGVKAGDPQDAVALGTELGTQLLKEGGEEILREIYSAPPERKTPWASGN